VDTIVGHDMSMIHRPKACPKLRVVKTGYTFAPFHFCLPMLLLRFFVTLLLHFATFFV
jgi:hypothetical protein